MALTKEDLQAISELMDAKLEPIKEQQAVHNRSITNLEQNVLHELKLLSENLPDALARSEKLEEVSGIIEEHGHRIFALEQQAANT